MVDEKKKKGKNCRTTDDLLHYVLDRRMLHYHFQLLALSFFLVWIIRSVSTKSFY